MDGYVIPWKAEATVVKRPLKAGDDPELVFEGTLAGAVRYRRERGRGDVSRYAVSLPNRATQPRSYQGAALVDLLASAPQWLADR